MYVIANYNLCNWLSVVLFCLYNGKLHSALTTVFTFIHMMWTTYFILHTFETCLDTMFELTIRRWPKQIFFRESHERPCGNMMLLLAPETAPLMDFTGPQSFTINVIKDAYSTARLLKKNVAINQNMGSKKQWECILMQGRQLQRINLVWISFGEMHTRERCVYRNTGLKHSLVHHIM